MDIELLALVLVIALALTFDFTNGFHDTANSIATTVGTRAMAPQPAVLMAAVFNFVGAFISIEVAATIGKDIIDPSMATITVVLGALVGAITWNMVTWYFGIPSSSSHALVGGLIGSAIASAGMSSVLWSGVFQKVALAALIAPTMGFLGALVVLALAMRIFRKMNASKANHGFRRAQILTGAWLSLTHGTNDAQKTMGIMSLALVTYAGGSTEDFEVPMWVIVSAATAMGLGTYAGGWRIIKTLGSKVVRMEPVQGFSASVSGATVLWLTAHYGIPVSTTHCVSGCVMGAGAAKRLSSVRWNIAGDIVSAWILTLPCAAAVGALSFYVAAIHPLLLLAAVGAGGWLLHTRVEQRKTRALDSGLPIPSH